MNIVAFLLILLLYLSSQAMADAKGPTLEEIVVTATRTELSLSQAPGWLKPERVKKWALEIISRKCNEYPTRVFTTKKWLSQTTNFA